MSVTPLQSRLRAIIHHQAFADRNDQVVPDYTLDPQAEAEAHFPADRTATAYRRLLAGMGLGKVAEKETPL